MKAGRRSEVRISVGKILFYKNTENAVKINNSPRFTAFTAKRCKKYAVKIIFFHRISPHFLRRFTAKPRPGMANTLTRSLFELEPWLDLELTNTPDSKLWGREHFDWNLDIEQLLCLQGFGIRVVNLQGCEQFLRNKHEQWCSNLLCKY